jgi:hypothetical protein
MMPLAPAVFVLRSRMGIGGHAPCLCWRRRPHPTVRSRQRQAPLSAGESCCMCASTCCVQAEGRSHVQASVCT